MKNRMLLGLAVLVVGLLVCASSASAALTYFDAQILDIPSGKTLVLANTTFADGTPFTALPLGPGGEGPPATTDPAGNWTTADSGIDNLWRQRVNAAFGNTDASTNGTVYEARGTNGGPNSEDPGVLKTTISVPSPDQGATVGVYAMFWTDSSNWQVAASLTISDDLLMPVYQGNFQEFVPASFVFEVFDVGDLGNIVVTTGADGERLDMNGLTTSDGAGTAGSGSNRRFYAAFLGNVTLGTELSVFISDGVPLSPAQLLDNGGANHRTWYDGIAYGATQDLDVSTLEPPPIIPEPASATLFALALAGVGLMRRRSG